MSAEPAPPELSLVICTLNEVQAIGPLIEEVAAALAGRRYEIIVVDDGSTDGTPQAVRALANPDVRLIERRGVRGLASAALAGWDAAEAPVLGLMDGDGQHDPALLPDLLGGLNADGVDLLIGARDLKADVQGFSAARLRLSLMAVWLTGAVLGTRLQDPMSGYFVMRRSFYRSVRQALSAVGFKILIDLVASSPVQPVRVREVRTALRPRRGGVSKLDARVIADLAALLAEKRLGGLLGARFILFAAVGLSGVVINLAVLAVLLRGGHLRYAVAEPAAILAAMVWNFWLNNLLTFRERGLEGWALARGLLAFIAACAVGAVLNVALSGALYRIGAPWTLAGVIGALAGGIFNFWAVRRVTWSVPPQRT